MSSHGLSALYDVDIGDEDDLDVEASTGGGDDSEMGTQPTQNDQGIASQEESAIGGISDVGSLGGDPGSPQFPRHSYPDPDSPQFPSHPNPGMPRVSPEDNGNANSNRDNSRGLPSQQQIGELSDDSPDDLIPLYDFTLAGECFFYFCPHCNVQQTN